MTDKQLLKVRRNAYKYYDEVIFEHDDWNKRDIAIFSFQSGADYALKNKYDELKDDADKKNDKPNIVQFLRDNRVYERFIVNLLNHKQGEDLSYYLLTHLFGFNAISGAFIWSETPEGPDFWEEISSKWNKQF